MLLFIGNEYTILLLPVSFNTSHVTLYPMKIVFYWKLEASFNTSHVTLYLLVSSFWVSFPWFQYISCYSLSNTSIRFPPVKMVSIHLMLLFIEGTLQDGNVKEGFQYISCYSLSASIPSLKIISQAFQYISCYSLSSTCFPKKMWFLSFNTSHVTLYRPCTDTECV